ncbi:MAG: PorV/PorQ family protein [bacterium]|nr:PorV/PorQ family protein [bacterium]
MKTGINLMILLGFLSLLHAGEKEGDSPLQFLKISPSPAGFSLGNSYAPLLKNADTFYYNPAATAFFGLDLRPYSPDKDDPGRMNYYRAPFMDNISVSLNYARYFESIHYGALFGTFSMNRFGTAGIGLFSSIHDDVPQTGLDADDQYYPVPGSITMSDYCLMLNYGHKITDKTGAGINLKGIISRLGEYTARSFAADAGLLYQDHRGGAGFTVKNLGTSFQYAAEGYKLPVTLQIGGYYILNYRKLLLTPGDRILLTGGITKEINSENIYTLGIEYSWKNFIYLRTGLQVNGNDEGLRAGLGLCYRNYQVNYAMSGYENLGIVHRMGFAVSMQKQRELQYSIKQDHESFSVMIRGKRPLLIRDQITETGHEVLDEIAERIKKKDYRRVLIKVYPEKMETGEGDTDTLRKQAQIIAEYLIKKGIVQNKVTSRGCNFSVPSDYQALLKESYSDKKYEIIILEWKKGEKEKFNYYYYIGLDAYIRQWPKIALENWEQALIIDPENEEIKKRINQTRSENR